MHCVASNQRQRQVAGISPSETCLTNSFYLWQQLKKPNTLSTCTYNILFYSFISKNPWYSPCMLQVCFEYASSNLQVCFMYASSMLQVCVKCASTMLQVFFKYAPCMLQVCFMYTWCIFQLSLNYASCHQASFIQKCFASSMFQDYLKHSSST